MRLTSEQILAIKKTAHQVLGQDVRVTLFGSRVNDALKGGDIDLLFEVDRAVGNRALVMGALYASLISSLGDRKIDVLFKDAVTPMAPVMAMAHQTGVVL
jgi:predicted nucleotidyltransferase